MSAFYDFLFLRNLLYLIQDSRAYCLYIRRPSAGDTNSSSGRPRTPTNSRNTISGLPRKERKTKPEKKTKLIAMRFTESDYNAIKRKANRANMNFTGFVTAAALNKPITVISGFDDVLREQKAIGNNLNQLTVLCRMGRIQCPDLKELTACHSGVMEQLSEILRR